jgi:hypothetical protein
MKEMNAAQLQAELAKRLNAAVKAAETALYQGASIIMTEAKKRAPLDVGTLRNSGYVTLPRRDGNDVSVEAGFGGAAKAYAVRQHEETSYNHEVGEAKYLQNAIDAKENEVRARVQRLADKALASGRAPGGGSYPHPREPSEEVMQGESRHRRKRGGDS